MPTILTLRKNGSIKVEGDFTLLDENGQPVAVPEGKPISLCRCGDSRKKPFCDGSAHKQNGYCSVVPDGSTGKS
jgi:CDGSH-type Zn-finger protein